MRIVIRLMSVVTHGEDKKKTKIIYVVIRRIVIRLMPVVTLFLFLLPLQMILIHSCLPKNKYSIAI